LAGPASAIERAGQVAQALIDLARMGETLDVHDVERLVSDEAHGELGRHGSSPEPEKIILPGLRRVIQPKTNGQREYLRSIAEHDIVIGIGPAGTGKTYLAVAAAVDALARKRVRRIVLARPAVEAGENLGFLPGDLQEKVDPYLRPLYDALEDMMPRERVQKARYHLVRWAWVPALALVVHLAFPTSAADVAPLLEPGARADKEIVAPFNFVVNKSEDELQREAEELAASAKPIYEFRQHAYDSAATTMAAFFSVVDAAIGDGPQAVIHAADDFGVPLTPQEAAHLAKGGRRRALQQALQRLFDRTLAQGVTGPGVLQVEQSRELIIRRGSTESSVQRDQVVTFAQYLRRAKQLHPDAGSSVGDVLYLKLVRQFFRPTLIPNYPETVRRRNELRGSVDPSKYIVRAGDRIVAPHEVVTNEAHERLVVLHQELLRRGAATTYSIRGVLGPLLRDSLILAIFWVLMVFYRRETYRDL